MVLKIFKTNLTNYKMFKNLHKLKNTIQTFSDPVKNLESVFPEVDNWIVSKFVLDKLVPIVGFHPFPLNELMLMTSTVCRFKPEFIFEWGTNIGKSARIFYEIRKGFTLNFEIHSVDLPDDVFHNEHPKHDRGLLVRNISDVHLHQGDGLDCSLSLIQKKAPKGNILFFVDGDHSFESVKRELGSILESVPNAVVLLHDTFYQSNDSGYNVGPNLAVAEIMSMKNEYEVVSTVLGLPGMSLVYKKFN